MRILCILAQYDGYIKNGGGQPDPILVDIDFLQYSSVNTDDRCFDRNISLCLLQGSLGQLHQAGTTGYLHDDDRQGLNFSLID